MVWWAISNGYPFGPAVLDTLLWPVAAKPLRKPGRPQKTLERRWVDAAIFVTGITESRHQLVHNTSYGGSETSIQRTGKVMNTIRKNVIAAVSFALLASSTTSAFA